MWSTIFVVTIFFVVVVVQTTPIVTISAPAREGGSSPTEGNQEYYLDCTIQNFNSTWTPVWSKDGDIIVWDTEVRSADYQVPVKEFQDTSSLRQTVDFTQLTVRHTGLYTCFVVVGDITSYTEVVSSDAIWISVNSSSGFNFPPPQWPECHPQEAVVVLYGTILKFTCVSQPGDPKVNIEFQFQEERFTGWISDSNLEIRRMYQVTILPKHHGKSFTCSITSPGEPFNGKTRQCTTGKVQVQLATYKSLTLFEGAAGFLSCIVPSGDNIFWMTETESQGTRLDTKGINGLAMLQNVDISDNGTYIGCHAVNSNITDYIQITVIPSNMSKYESPTQSPSQFPTTQNTTLIPMPFVFTATNIAIIAGGGVFLLIIFISCIIVCVCCCRKEDTDDRKTGRDLGDLTGNSNGYVTDKEMSQMSKDIPHTSQKLSERRTHDDVETPSDPQQSNEDISKSMSSSLMLAMTQLPGDDPKRNSTAYETITEYDFKNSLSSDSPICNTFMRGPAPSEPAPPPPSQDSPAEAHTYVDVKKEAAFKHPTYAVPEKDSKSLVKAYDLPIKDQKSDTIPEYAYASSKQITEEVGGSSENSYAIVHPDPENPTVRALSKEHYADIMNGEIKSDDEEGFVENEIYEPAGSNS